jgi:NitT/TauT family transport system ATP-binding protein
MTVSKPSHSEFDSVCGGRGSSAAPPQIELEGVAKSYGRGRHAVPAVRGFDLCVGVNEFVSILGPSGCGKSTVLMMIAGLVRPTAGRLNVAGTPVEGPRHDYGIVFQTPVLLPWRTVLDNVLLPVEMRGENTKDYIPRALELLKTANIADFQDRLPRELSGGMRQRAGICRALVHNPSILLMDEPFSALDALTRDEMNVELLKLWERDRKTVVFVTHSISEAVLLSDRVVVMSPRPSVIIEDVKIDLPRPRSEKVQESKEFVELCARLRRLITR